MRYLIISFNSVFHKCTAIRNNQMAIKKSTDIHNNITKRGYILSSFLNRLEIVPNKLRAFARKFPFTNVLFDQEQFSIQCRKYIWDCFGFASLRSVTGPKYSRHFLNQSDSKLKPIVTSVFPRFRHSLVFTFVSNWLFE